jgi:methylase of polypeptide subunit release factors
VAVFGGHDGFEIVRRLVPAAVERAPLVAIEVGMGMAQVVGGMLRDAGAVEIAVERDLAGIERVVVGRR